MRLSIGPAGGRCGSCCADFADEEPLSVAEIDTLCDRLNDIDARCDSETA